MKVTRMGTIVLLCLVLAVPALAANPYRKDWSGAKKKAEKEFSTACETAKKSKKFKEKCTFIKFDKDLGPKLDKIAKQYDAVAKSGDPKAMEQVRQLDGEIKTVVKEYLDLIAAHQKKWKADIGDGPWDDLEKVLKSVGQGAELTAGEAEKTFRKELHHWDMTQLVTKTWAAKIPHLTASLPAGYDISIFMEGKASKQVENNPLLHQLLYDAAWDKVQDVGGTFKTMLEAIDAKVAANAYDDLEKARKEIEATYSQTAKSMAAQAEQSMNEAWAKFQKENAEYRNYQIKTTLSITSKAIGVVVGTAGAVLGGITGVGSVVGIIATVKTSISLLDEAKTLLTDANTLGRKIEADITAMKKQLDAESKNIAGTKEVAKAALERLSGIKVNSVAGIEKDFGTYQGKLKGYQSKASELAKRINPALTEARGLSKKVDYLQAEAKKRNVPVLTEALAKFEPALEKAEKAIDGILGSVSSMMQAYNDGMKNVDRLKSFIDDLKRKQPTWVDGVNTYVIPMLEFVYINPDTTLDLIQTTVGKATSVTAELVTAGTGTSNEVKGIVANEGQATALGGKDGVLSIVSLFTS